MDIRFVSAEEVMAALTPARAVAAVQAALRGGFEPADDPPRTAVQAGEGQLLLMPSRGQGGVGVKIATVAPNNPAAGLPRIQALYALFDRDTLSPRAVIDGAALTTLRTPAVSIAAVLPALLRREMPLSVVIFGAGPQGVGHADTLAACLGDRGVSRTTFVVRSALRAAPEVAERGDVVEADSPAASVVLAEADVIVCATTSRVPLFDSTVVRTNAVVIAVGSHELDAREIDSALMGRAQVIVEDVATALRESGDVIQAIRDGTLSVERLLTIRDVVNGAAPLDTRRPIVFKSSGMAWEDLVVAQAVIDALTR